MAKLTARPDGREPDFLGHAPATASDVRLAASATVLLLLVLVGAAFFAATPLHPIPAITPTYNAAVIVLYVMTALLLYPQFEALKERSFLALACGYVFTPVLMAGHLLSVPDAFVPGSLVGSNQSSAWLWTIWHTGFPVFVAVYAILARHERQTGVAPTTSASGRLTATALIGTAAVAGATVLGCVLGESSLPPLLSGSDYRPWTAAIVLISGSVSHAVGLILLVWGTRLRRLIDLWLGVALVAITIELVLSGFLVTGRYELGWYLGRVCGLAAASFVLGVLIRETARLNVGALKLAVASRDNEARQAFLVHLGDALRELADPMVVQRTASRVLRTHLGADRVVYAEMSGDDLIEVVASDAVDGMPNVLGRRYRVSDFGADLQGELRAGRIAFREDVRLDPSLSSDDRGRYVALRILAWATASLVKEGRLVAVLTAHFSTPHSWTPRELAVLEDTAERTWAAAERARAETALGASEARYRTLFDSIDEGFCILEQLEPDTNQVSDFRILEVNAAQQTITGLSDVVGRRITEVIPAIEHQWLELLTGVVRTGKALRVEGYVAGLSGWFDVHASRIGSPDSCLVAVVFRDTTSRKLAEATLRESEARQAFLVTLHDTLRAQTDATEIQRLATELLGERLQVNRCHYAEVEGDDIRLAGAYVSGVRPLPSRFSQMTFGTALLQASRRGERVLSHNVETDPRLPANDRAALKAAEIAAFVGVMLIKNGQWVAAFGVDSNTPRAWTPSELTLISEVAERTWDAVHRARAEAALRESEAALRSTRDELERRVRERTMELATTNASLEIQIRDRRAAGEQVKALFRRLVSVQEEERRRIARDLHDQLGQQMTALRIQLAALRGNVVTLPDIAQQADRLERATADLDRSIDFLTWGLRPAVLDHLGLAAALRHLVTDWSERFRIPADFQAVGADSLRLSREAEANLYRIAQEALHNVLKHAEANDVAVLLERRSDHAVLIVEDNGRGFDPDAAQSDAVEPGMGLIGMRERAALLGGVFEVETVLGQGTSVFVRVPLGDHTPETSAESHADDPASSRFT